ncbi:hypothetical protein LY632_06920 [Erythrobacter sp. SDW2]|uniref:hypothetical protein n=1 Tax=Erythrobacter sp. SDW2 TaxID=2907154 RepID=UPI001F2D9415|nr:hypothetical protein [Erythrobacter sp. SDW2]UIP08120.1 hypothetical protein LY632_06920 [Erythrobacter sp. SDW2]
MGDYQEDYRNGYYGIGGGSSHGYDQGRRARAEDDARMRGNSAFPDATGGHGHGDGSAGGATLLGIIAIGAGLWAMRAYIPFAIGAALVSALALKLAAKLTGAHIGWLEALGKSLAATGIAVLAAVVIFGGATASLMLGGGEIIPGFMSVMSDNFWQPDVVVGNALATFTLPLVLILAAATWWLDRSVEPGTGPRVVRWLALGGSVLAGPGLAVVVGLISAN